MSPTIVPLKIYRNMTFAHCFTLLDDDKQPIDLTGCTAEFSARLSDWASADTINLSGTPGLTIDEEAGTIDIFLDVDDVNAIGAKELDYTLKVSDGTNVIPYFLGTITISNKSF